MERTRTILFRQSARETDSGELMLAGMRLTTTEKVAAAFVARGVASYVDDDGKKRRWYQGALGWRSEPITR